MQIKKDLISKNKYNIKCPYKMQAEFIVAHNTANDASAKNEIAYMKRNNNQTSYHIAVDDKEAIQAIPFDRNAWHAGDGATGKGNRKGIAVEICYSKSGGARFDKAEKNGAKVIAKLLKDRNWGISKLKKHQDFSGKYCPHRTLDRGWNRFVNMVKKELGQTTSKPSKPSTNTKKGNTTTNSIVTYLNSIGVDSSYSNRSKLAKQHGISNYKGTAAQNTKLLNILRKGSTNKSTTNYKGKRVESIHNGNLRFYNRPSWSDSALAGTVKKGYGFPTILDKVKVGSSYQYKVKNSKGKVFYITANSKYVKIK